MGRRRSKSPVLFKRGETFYYYTTDSLGKRTYRSLRTTDEEEARRSLAQITAPEDVRTLGDVLDGYWTVGGPQWDRAQARGDRASRLYWTASENLIEKWFRPLFDTPIEQVTTRFLEDFLILLRKDLSSSSLNNLIKALRRPFSEATSTGKIASSPVDGLRPFSNAKTPRRGSFTDDEIKALFSIPPEKWGGFHFMMAAMISAFTGLRQGEIRALTINDLQDETLHVTKSLTADGEIKSTKTGNDRIVPVSGYLLERLEIIAFGQRSRGLLPLLTHNDKPLVPRTMNWKFHNTLEAAKIVKGDRTWQSLRGFAASSYLASGASFEAVQSMMGHSPGSKTTMAHYARLQTQKKYLEDIAIRQEKLQDEYDAS